MFVAMLFAATSMATDRDFGPDGLEGLSAAQKKALSQGKIVLASKGSSENALIEAAMVFNKSPKETWDLLSKTEAQPLYLNELDDVKVVKRSATDGKEIHSVSYAFMDIVYGVLFKFHKSEMYFYWWLDPSRENDLAGLEGFWRFYPYGEGKTLARYGSFVSAKNVPSWVESFFKERGVKKTLFSVEKYVNSGGTYHK